jgi:hypothetical protein
VLAAIDDGLSRADWRLLAIIFLMLFLWLLAVGRPR